MKQHNLKTIPQYFNAVQAGKKNFELRYNDRDYQVGDTVVLEEFSNGVYTGQESRTFVITYVLRDFAGLEKDYCIFGLQEEAK